MKGSLGAIRRWEFSRACSMPSSFPNADLMKRTASVCEDTVVASLDAAATGLSGLRDRNRNFVKLPTAITSISREKKVADSEAPLLGHLYLEAAWCAALVAVAAAACCRRGS